MRANNQVISNTRFESRCSTKGEGFRFSSLETQSALCLPQEAGFTLHLKISNREKLLGGSLARSGAVCYCRIASDPDALASFFKQAGEGL